jgi:hypothetical protein
MKLELSDLPLYDSQISSTSLHFLRNCVAQKSQKARLIFSYLVFDIVAIFIS